MQDRIDTEFGQVPHCEILSAYSDTLEILDVMAEHACHTVVACKAGAARALQLRSASGSHKLVRTAAVCVPSIARKANV